jgi:hypothetical protein
MSATSVNCGLVDADRDVSPGRRRRTGRRECTRGYKAMRTLKKRARKPFQSLGLRGFRQA